MIRVLWIEDSRSRAMPIIESSEFQRLVDCTWVPSCREALEVVSRGVRPDLIVLDVVLGDGVNGIEEAIGSELERSPWLLLSDLASNVRLDSKHDVRCMSAHILRDDPGRVAMAWVQAHVEIVSGVPGVARSVLRLLIHEARSSIEIIRYELLVNGVNRDSKGKVDEQFDRLVEILNRIALQ